MYMSQLEVEREEEKVRGSPMPGRNVARAIKWLVLNIDERLPVDLGGRKLERLWVLPFREFGMQGRDDDLRVENEALLRTVSISYEDTERNRVHTFDREMLTSSRRRPKKDSQTK